MAYHASSRWGGDEPNPSPDRLREILAEMDFDDDEHPDVALSHESEWTLSAFPSGFLIWENVAEDDEPRHMRDVTREQVLELWLKLAAGEIAAIDAEPWLPGYGA